MSSDAHAAAATRNAALATAAVQARIAARQPWVCAQCGAERAATTHQCRQTYCSKQCMSQAYRTRLQGVGNPNWRETPGTICAWCRCEFRTRNRERKFCGRRCADYSRVEFMRRAAKVDANHSAIIDAMRRVGARVMDLSGMAMGVPDLLVEAGGHLMLVEVKNPASAYGRKGLNGNQIKFRDAGWPVAVVKSEGDAVLLVGRLRLIGPSAAAELS